MASVSYQISNLLEKMASNDKDFRFMATNDLMSELQKDSIKLDDDSEKKVVRMVLRLLEDKNGEVQNLAVKCLGPLVNKVKECQVETIVDSLCANMVSNKEQLRDISSIGLKTVISELPHSTGSTGLAANVCQRITGKLSTAIEKEDVSVQLEALDILSDLLSRFGELLVPFHTTILAALVPQLDSPRQAVRKRTIVALSHALTSCSTQLYNKVVEHLLDGLEQHDSAGSVRTYIQCLASICRHAGHRLCGHMERAMELLVRYSHEEDDELREFCLQACEAFVNKCPEPIHPHIPTITELCLSYIGYDPNYNYEADNVSCTDSNDLSDHLAMDTEDETEDGDSEEYSDDDDMSWKVRRSAAKCLEAVITGRPELMEEFYRAISPVLISRFKEREENVKSDIFHAYIALLKATRPNEDSTMEPESMEQQDTLISQLQEQVPRLLKAIIPLMREKSVKTRQDCFMLLRELLAALPGALSDYIHGMMPGIHYSLGCDKATTSNIKIEALGFVYILLSTHPPAVFYHLVKGLVSLVVIAVADPFYKIATEALLVLQQIVKVIRPLDDLEQPFQFAHLVPTLYCSTVQRLRTPEVDQEVKERAIACMGQLIANLGDYLKPELDTCLPIFLERLRNEVTRLSTVKALTVIASSPLQVNLCPILSKVIPVLGSFLRKNQRALKLNSLTLLNTIVLNYCHCFESNLLLSAIGEMQPLLNESDLHVATLTLTVLTSTAQKLPSALLHVNDYILPEVLLLVRSPLLQGSALNSMLLFFQAIVAANLPRLGYRDLLSMLVAPVLQPGKVQLHKQAYHSMARCVAALTLQCQNEAVPVAKELLQDVQRPRSDSHLVFCLLTIGEIGRHIDLSVIEPLPVVLLDTFATPSEEVKGAASHALGAVCVGNLEHYLPFILREIEAQPKKQYLLLHSLKEVITSLSVSPEKLAQLLPSVPAIWSQLFLHCECAEEGSRNVVAECLGKLVLVDPQNLLPQLRQALDNPSALMRTTVVTAVKFTISDQPQAVDPLLKQCIGQFLSALEDPEVSVRRVALVAFNSAVHNKPSLVRDLLVSLLPQLYEETKVKKELIREVEMGPFKHTVDDGLDIRKAAFECMYTLLEQGLEKVDVFQFLDHVQGGLKDHYDIKMLTYLMTARLAQLCPNAVLQRLEQLVEPLRATCTLKVKANSVKQEYEKQDELKRSALRAVAALLAIPKADKNPHLSDFMSLIRGSTDLLPLYESVQKDTTLNCDQNNQMDQS